MKKNILLSTIFLLSLPFSAQTQDTVQVSLQTFIEQGIENSGQINYERGNIGLAENRIHQAKARRFLPEFEFNTQHGAIPGVVSRTNLPENQYYLDPNLENDWEDWAIFTRAEMRLVQPVFTWGALKNAVQAAQSAAVAAREQFEKQQADLRIRLFDLYQSYLLTLEIEALIDEARERITDIEQQIEKRQEEGTEDFDDSDLFQFEIFKSEFDMQVAQIREEAAMTQRIWNYVLDADPNTVYMPDTYFLDPVPEEIKEIAYYRSNAIAQRAEISAIEAGIDAAEHGLKANQMKNLPALFLGLTGSFANTPNRPRQSNPFIINSTNYASGAVGFGIRQNLDFLSMEADVEKSRIEFRQAKFLRDAAVDGIVLEINEAYKAASLSKTRVEKTDEALVTSKKWLRQEQLDYDFGIGETQDLFDAMKKELELQVQLKREIYDFNTNMADLYRKAGLPIMEIMNNEQ